MPNIIAIDPVTRVEGEVRVVIELRDDGRVENVYYQTLELRGFEAFCRGRQVEELPRITSAVCGVCSWAHHMASGKALDQLIGREPPELASKLRELAYYMQIIDSHILHFVVMALPDFVLPKADPLERNIVGLLRSEPKLVSLFLRSRDIIKRIEKIFGGKPIHVAYVVPGGVSKKLCRDDIEKLEKLISELHSIIAYLAEYFREKVAKSDIYQEYLLNERYSLKTYYMGLVGKGNRLSFYDGELRIIDPHGKEIVRFRPKEYNKYIGEYSTKWAYSKFPFLKQHGWRGFNEEYLLRVGPLARMNIIDRLDGEEASYEYGEMIDKLGGKPIHQSMASHWARIIETVYSIERMKEIISGEDLINGENVSFEGEIVYEGVGVVEAPRGTLIHHYRADEKLRAVDVNIITPTTFNNAAINTELRKVAEKLFPTEDIGYELLNQLEISIRAYDPCNSCATHIIDPKGRGLFSIVVMDKEGRIIHRFPGGG